MKSLDEYKDFSEHESPFCQGIDINMKIYQYDSVEYLEILYMFALLQKMVGSISTMWY